MTTFVSLAPALVVFAAVVGVYLLMLGRLRRNGYVPKTWRGARSLRFPDRVRGWPAGLVATTAALAIFDAFDLADATLAGLAGVSIAVIALVGRRAADVVFDLLALGAIIATVVDLLAQPDCTDVAGGWAVAAVSALLISSLIAYVAGVFLRWSRPSGVFLVVFALLEIAVFLALPLGVPLMAESPAMIVVTVIIAAIAGFAAAIFPGYVLGLGALGVTLASLGIAAGFGTMCSTAGVWWPVVGLVAFALVFLLGSMFSRGRG